MGHAMRKVNYQSKTTMNYHSGGVGAMLAKETVLRNWQYVLFAHATNMTTKIDRLTIIAIDSGEKTRYEHAGDFLRIFRAPK